MDEREFIDVLAKMRKEIGSPEAALAVSLELPERSMEKSYLLAEDIRVGICGHRFAVVFLQLGFVVPGIDVAEAALKENVDDATGLRGDEAMGGK